MANCNLLDFRCIFVSEIFGNVLLTVLFATLFYFIIAAKLRFGFDTTIAFAFPLLLIAGLAFAGFSAVFAFSTVIIGLIVAWILNVLINNR